MSVLELREKFLCGNHLKLLRVNIPEYEVDVYCKIISGEERQQFMDLAISFSSEGDFDAAHHETELEACLISLAYCDELGNRIFNNDDIELLGRINWQVLHRLFAIAQEHNKLTREALEDLGKNLLSSQSENSGSL